MNYRVVWKQLTVLDPYTNKPKVIAVWPSRQPVRLSSWKDRFQDFAAFDLVLLAAIAVCVALAVATR